MKISDILKKDPLCTCGHSRSNHVFGSNSSRHCICLGTSCRCLEFVYAKKKVTKHKKKVNSELYIKSKYFGLVIVSLIFASFFLQTGHFLLLPLAFPGLILIYFASVPILNLFVGLVFFYYVFDILGLAYKNLTREEL